ncbi:hypothetical protein F4818DRAFT_438683 [Hypoxylon cercidicola]|nr:hypothetical protein F4818DRAFT_438683 [Hypoxylon cercidicola]
MLVNKLVLLAWGVVATAIALPLNAAVDKSGLVVKRDDEDDFGPGLFATRDDGDIFEPGDFAKRDDGDIFEPGDFA